MLTRAEPNRAARVMPGAIAPNLQGGRSRSEIGRPLQQTCAACLGGDGKEAHEQNTQQSHGTGFKCAPQPARSG